MYWLVVYKDANYNLIRLLLLHDNILVPIIINYHVLYLILDVQKRFGNLQGFNSAYCISIR